MNRTSKYCALIAATALGWWAGAGIDYVAGEGVATQPAVPTTLDWPQWGGDAAHNNTPVGHNIPTEWETGDFDYKTGAWDPSTAKNIKWTARLGSQSVWQRGGRRRKNLRGHEQQWWLARTVPLEKFDLGLSSCALIWKRVPFFGSTVAKSCLRGVFMIGRCKGFAVRRWWKATGFGL